MRRVSRASRGGPHHRAAEWTLLVALVLGLAWVLFRKVEATTSSSEADVWLHDNGLQDLQEVFHQQGETIEEGAW